MYIDVLIHKRRICVCVCASNNAHVCVTRDVRCVEYVCVFVCVCVCVRELPRSPINYEEPRRLLRSHGGLRGDALCQAMALARGY